MNQPWSSYDSSEEAQWGKYIVTVYFKEGRGRVGCQCEEYRQDDSMWHSVEVPSTLHRASLLWSETDYRNQMSLQEFIDRMLV